MPIRAVRNFAGLVKIPQRWKRILIVPLRPPRAMKVAARFVNVKGGVYREVQFQQCVHHLIPSFRKGCRCLLPEFPCFAETLLLILIVVIQAEVLYSLVGE